eukprot:TRINITY_DN16561_c0_g1_i1.p1 TRINITY_DN16561_c0_g1~~TRINITY_DN16561_c0_g1_i1.p1  ORF type:complete len:487 (-),score=82.09 TRINITY_DN16561_c0_g1_i1:1744-3204(-)
MSTFSLMQVSPAAITSRSVDLFSCRSSDSTCYCPSDTSRRSFLDTENSSRANFACNYVASPAEIPCKGNLRFGGVQWSGSRSSSRRRESLTAIRVLSPASGGAVEAAAYEGENGGAVSLVDSTVLSAGREENGTVAFANGAVPSSVTPSDFSRSVPAGRLSLAGLTAPVAEDLETLNRNLKTVVGERHPMLMAAAEQIFGAGGKRMRPALVFLVSRATCQLNGLSSLQPQHRRLAEITEMIHTASLVHDDVLDSSPVRRGRQTVHETYGIKVAVLAGDFMFAQASWFLANLDNLEVIKLISQVIADFANGEIEQAARLFDTGLTLEEYLEKSFFKTASLLAASTKSAAIFSLSSPATSHNMYEYGRHLGLAFQVVDDILDFTQSSAQLGKPAGSDLASGNLTAPVLFALKGAHGDALRDLIDSEFVDDGALERAVQLVIDGGGIEEARALAKSEGEAARSCLSELPEGEVRRSLEGMVDYVLERLF